MSILILINIGILGINERGDFLFIRLKFERNEKVFVCFDLNDLFVKILKNKHSYEISVCTMH